MNKVFSLPSPEELIKKEVTRPVTIRIKESTMLVFEKYAKQCNVTSSAIINNLLDAYAANLELSSEDDLSASKKIMQDYLNKIALKVASKDIEELFLDLCQNAHYINPYGQASIEEYLRTYREAIIDPESADLDVLLYTVYTNDELNVDFSATTAEKAKINQWDEDSRWVFVPIKKWLILADILLLYRKKYDKLFGGECCFIPSKKNIERIIDVINNNSDNKKLALEISKAFIEYINDLED